MDGEGGKEGLRERGGWWNREGMTVLLCSSYLVVAGARL